MPRSKAFAGIKRDILRISASIPAGQLTTFASIGDYLSVVPRQVAYILATLTDAELQSVPWHRVVSLDGQLAKAKADAQGRTQAELLLAEGLTVVDGKVLDFPERFIDVQALPHEVVPHKQYLAEG